MFIDLWKTDMNVPVYDRVGGQDLDRDPLEQSDASQSEKLRSLSCRYLALLLALVTFAGLAGYYLGTIDRPAKNEIVRSPDTVNRGIRSRLLECTVS